MPEARPAQRVRRAAPRARNRLPTRRRLKAHPAHSALVRPPLGPRRGGRRPQRLKLAAQPLRRPRHPLLLAAHRRETLLQRRQPPHHQAHGREPPPVPFQARPREALQLLRARRAPRPRARVRDGREPLLVLDVQPVEVVPVRLHPARHELEQHHPKREHLRLGLVVPAPLIRGALVPGRPEPRPRCRGDGPGRPAGLHVPGQAAVDELWAHLRRQRHVAALDVAVERRPPRVVAVEVVERPRHARRDAEPHLPRELRGALVGTQVAVESAARSELVDQAQARHGRRRGLPPCLRVPQQPNDVWVAERAQHVDLAPRAHQRRASVLVGAVQLDARM